MFLHIEKNLFTKQNGCASRNKTRHCTMNVIPQNIFNSFTLGLAPAQPIQLNSVIVHLLALALYPFSPLSCSWGCADAGTPKVGLGVFS